MFETIGKWEPDYLLSDPNGAARLAIPCAPGNSVIQRGMIMKRGDNGMYEPAAAADIVNTNFLVILDETVDTNASETVAAEAAAFRGGRVIVSRVHLKDDGTLTAAHKLVLRQQGFLMDILMGEAEEFNNSTEG